MKFMSKIEMIREHKQIKDEFQETVSDVMWWLRKLSPRHRSPSMRDHLKDQQELKNRLLALRALCDEHIEALTPEGAQRPRLADWPETI